MTIGWTLSVERKDFLEELAQTEIANGHTFLYILESVGWDTISHLRSHVGGTRPPIGARTVKGASGEYTYVPPRGRAEGPRPAHPGGWADVTTNLANAYRFEIWANNRRVRWVEQPLGLVPEGSPFSYGVEPMVVSGSIPAKPKPPFELVFLNDMEYAAYLEAMDGFFVLSGVTEPGGPIDRALRAAISAVPGFELEG